MSINRRLVIALSAALLLAGCGGTPGQPAADTAGDTSAIATGTAQPSTGTPGTPAGPAGGTAGPGGGTAGPGGDRTGQTVTVRRSGGFAGVQDTVTVAPDGSWTSTDRSGTRRTGALGDAELARLRTLLDDPRLASEARALPGAGSRCSDAFEYQVTVGSLRVTYEQCPADGPPPPLADAIATLVGSATGLA